MTDHARDLEIARVLAEADIPIFRASRARREDGKWDPASGHNGCGYWLPKAWQKTEPDPSVVDRWSPHEALCAITGHLFDLIDFDPRNGGSPAALNGEMPTVYLEADTPSGGLHYFVRSLGARSRDGVLPGIDYKGGDADGQGRGFAFIAPTRKLSKATGEIGQYRWRRIGAGLAGLAEDRSGEKLAEMVRQAHTTGRSDKATPESGEDADMLRTGPWEDVPGLLAEGRHDGVYKLACSLRGRGGWRVGDALAHMRAVVWPEIDQTQAGHEFTEAEFEATIRDAFDRHEDGPSTLVGGEQETMGQTPSRPPLNVTNAATTADWLRERLGTGLLSGFFARGDKIVHTPRVGEEGYEPLTDDERHDDGPAQVRPASAEYIAARCQYTFHCYRTRVNRNGDLVVDQVTGKPKRYPAMFPTVAAKTAVNAVDLLPGISRLTGVTHTPLIRSDGTVLDTPGFDKATGVLYLPEPGLKIPPVPERPTPAEVYWALRTILHPIHKFPFVSCHDRANWVGLQLTPPLRQIALPPYKLGAMEAHQHRSGKTFLAEMIRATHGGVFRVGLSENDTELRKQISTFLDVTTGPVIVLDNVSGTLDSPVLAGLLTSAQWDDRKLGTNEVVISRPNDRLWLCTGNNMSLAADIPPRTVRSAIDAGMPHPERREFDFNPVQWVKTHRAETIWALLTLVRAWVVDGGRMGPHRSSDGYGRWLGTVNGILGYAREMGFDQTAGPFALGEFDHQSTQTDVGTDDDEWQTFLLAVHGVFGDAVWTVSELLDKIDTIELGSKADKDKPIPVDLLPAELAEKARRSGVRSINKSLGRWLGNRQGRWAGEITVRVAGKDENRKMWRIDMFGSDSRSGV
jgi:hypothetical protein